MGLAASQARLLMLTARSDDLEFKSENLTEERMVIANQVEQIFSQELGINTNQSSSTSYNYPNLGFSDVMKSIGGILNISDDGFMNGVKRFLSGGNNTSQAQQKQAVSQNTLDDKLAQLEEEDKKLELQLKQIDTQHKAVQTEEQSVEKVIQKNIETTFKILG